MWPGWDWWNGWDWADIHIIYEDLKFRNNYSCCRVPDNLILDCAWACIKNAWWAGWKGWYGWECWYCYSPSRTTACWFVRWNGKDWQPWCTGKHCLIKVTA